MRVKVTRTSDLRFKFRDKMRDNVFEYPDINSKKHNLDWYLNGHLVNTPINGVLAMADLAEYLLARARRHENATRAGKTTSANQNVTLVPAVQFYAATRRLMQNILSNNPINKPLTPKVKATVARKVAELIQLAKETMGRSSGRKINIRCKCNVCDERGTMSYDDYVLLEDILVKLSAEGVIGSDSKLFRKRPLTPSTVL